MDSILQTEETSALNQSDSVIEGIAWYCEEPISPPQLVGDRLLTADLTQNTLNARSLRIDPSDPNDAESEPTSSLIE